MALSIRLVQQLLHLPTFRTDPAELATLSHSDLAAEFLHLEDVLTISSHERRVVVPFGSLSSRGKRYIWCPHLVALALRAGRPPPP